MSEQLRGLRGSAWAPRVGRGLLIALVALVGAWLGVLLGGRVTQQVGPVETVMWIRPAIFGETQVDVAPLGSLSVESHDGPFAIEVDIRQIDLAAARGIVSDPTQLDGLEDRAVADLRSGLLRLALVASGCAILGAALLSLVVWRHPSRALVAGGVALGFVAVSGAVAGATWNPAAIAQPRYDGLLASAPSVVGSAQNIAADFDKYRQQLAKIVVNVSQLYDTASNLPTFDPNGDIIRVLHVSDIHLNLAAFDIIRSVVTQYRIDLVIDSGDFTDWGTTAEGQLAPSIDTVGVPYVWVRGNHDSQATQAAVDATQNGIVLDGSVREIAGVTVAGIGDPRFTPDKNTRDTPSRADLAEIGNRFAEQLSTLDPAPDIAVVHDPRVASRLDGAAPLILAGHMHTRETSLLPGGSRLMVQGSTGGAGLRGLEGEEPTPISLSVLYLDRTTQRLQAWDDITLGGLGLTSATIQRHQATAEEAAAPTPVVDGAGAAAPGQ